MTRKPAIRPAEGGSYIRQADGTLKRAEAITAPSETVEKTGTPQNVAEKPARKTPAKPAVKED